VCGTPRTLRMAKDDLFNNLGSFGLFEYGMRKTLHFKVWILKKI
jgi:hypothetical protein